MTKWLVALLLVGSSSCKRNEPALDLGTVDRSDGAVPELEVARAAGKPRIDGRIDEPVWKAAGATGALVSPLDGKARPGSGVNAEAWLTWDDDALYLAMTVYDADPSSPFARDDVDPHIWSKASGIELMLQPGLREDNRYYFEIQIDVGEAVWDTRFDDYNRPITGTGAEQRFGHQDLSARIERKVGVEEGRRYVVEAAIPWEAFAEVGAQRPAAGDSWRANLYSFRDGQRDALAWSPILGKGNFHKSSRFGILHFR